MSIQYSYEVVSVDNAHRIMQVAYSASGYPAVNVWIRLPKEGETLDQVVGLFAPLSYWEAQSAPTISVTVGASGTQTPAAPQPIEPTTCTPAQGLVALSILKGITETDIASAIESIPDPAQRYTAQIGYTRATTWERDSATMQALAGLLGLTEDDLDALFAYAAGVHV